MKLQKLLEEKSQFFKTREKVESWLEEMKIVNYTINKDLTVDVAGDVDIFYTRLKSLPIRFGVVSGRF